MRRAGLALLVAMLAVAGIPDAASAKRRACQPKGATTVVKTRSARVYERNGSVYGCLVSTGRSRVLDEDDDLYNSVYPVRLAGRFVAWGFSHTPECKADCPPGTTGSGYLGLIDLRSGRRRTTDAGPGSLVVTRFGAVAWIDSARSVNAWDGAGKRVLDAGPVTSTKLRLVGSLVLWRSGAGGRWEALRR